MKLIKLSATDSTNSFLKEMASNTVLENYTVVTTNEQIKGRGQQGSSWESEPFKNLMFSVFVSFKQLSILEKKYLNFAISLAVFDTLLEENIPAISIKWPNDILSGNKKVGGILIENSLKGSLIASSIIGIGLNVNQINFPAVLNKASSLQLVTHQNYNLELLLSRIISKLEEKVTLLNARDFKTLEAAYLKVLYKKNIPTMFKDSKDVLFMGIIRGISKDGKLQVELEDASLGEFGIKEISLA